MYWARMYLARLGWVALLAWPAAAAPEERLPTIPPAQYTVEQKQAAADFEAARKVPVFGPTQDYEWAVHYPIALKAGIRQEIADMIAEGRRPAAMNPDEDVVYEYSMELLKNKHVSNATFEHAKARFGAKGVVDLTGIVGYYTFLAMQLNAAQYQPPKDAKKLPRLPP
jgi:4-carboxymuconolactone decarboxylase